MACRSSARRSQGRGSDVLGGEVEPEQVRVEAAAHVEQPQPSGVGLSLERQVVFGPQLVLHEIHVARLQAQQLGVLVGDDLEHQAVERGQRLAVAPCRQ
jgi:hypothetical protein